MVLFTSFKDINTEFLNLHVLVLLENIILKNVNYRFIHYIYKAHTFLCSGITSKFFLYLENKLCMVSSPFMLSEQCLGISVKKNQVLQESDFQNPFLIFHKFQQKNTKINQYLEDICFLIAIRIGREHKSFLTHLLQVQNLRI